MSVCLARVGPGAPAPVFDLWHVFAVLDDVLLVINQFVAHDLQCVCSDRCDLRYSLDDVHHQMKTIQVIEHAHIERRRSGSFLFITSHMQVFMIRAPVNQPMNQPGIAVKYEYNRFVRREQIVKLSV